MTGHDTQTEEPPTDESAAAGASTLKKHLRSGTVAYAAGAVSLLRALRALRRSPGRASVRAAVGAGLIALGTAQRRLYRRQVDEAEETGLDEGRDIPFEEDDEETAADEEEADDEESGSDDETSAMAEKKHVDPGPPEDRTDADVSSAKLADDPGEAAGPTEGDAVPEQTDETAPEVTPGEDVDLEDPSEMDVEPADEEGEPEGMETDSEKAITNDDDAEESDDAEADGDDEDDA